MFSRLDICDGKLSWKCILIDESGLQEDGRTFFTGCIAAIGVSYEVHLEEGPMENKWKRAH